MAGQTQRQQRVSERRQRILSAAQERADADGWAAVTTRHLADTIGYTQPVLYGHFPGGKAEIMLAVALEGFVDLNEQCRAALGHKRGLASGEAVATAYLDFASEHPAVYEAMFQQPIGVPFASEDTIPTLREPFDLLAETIGDRGDGSATEVFWSALHGISLLERANRMRPEHRAHRVSELGVRFAAELPGTQLRGRVAHRAAPQSCERALADTRRVPASHATQGMNGDRADRGQPPTMRNRRACICESALVARQETSGARQGEGPSVWMAPRLAA